VRRVYAVLAGAALCCSAALPTASLAPAALQVQACAGAGLRPSAVNLAAVDAATLCLINRVRSTHHLRALRANRELGRVAGSQVGVMVRMDYFADVRPTGQTPLALVVASHYPAHAPRVSVGQNIAWGTGPYATPAEIVAAWMASPPHRAIVLDGEYRDAGVAATPATPSVIGAGRRGATYAILFGVRKR
jgi:uncharacterized protein YkwD